MYIPTLEIRVGPIDQWFPTLFDFCSPLGNFSYHEFPSQSKVLMIDETITDYEIKTISLNLLT